MSRASCLFRLSSISWIFLACRNVEGFAYWRLREFLEQARPEGPCTQYSGTRILGNRNCSAGFGQLYDNEVLGLGPVGFITCVFSMYAVVHLLEK